MLKNFPLEIQYFLFADHTHLRASIAEIFSEKVSLRANRVVKHFLSQSVVIVATLLDSSFELFVGGDFVCFGRLFFKTTVISSSSSTPFRAAVHHFELISPHEMFRKNL